MPVNVTGVKELIAAMDAVDKNLKQTNASRDQSRNDSYKG
jgi:hypothetical protein